MLFLTKDRTEIATWKGYRNRML